MNRLEKIDHKIKRNYRNANIAKIILVSIGSVIEITNILHFAKGTIEYIKTF